ncbi:MOFRL family protein [Shewanella sp. ALD9]|nr:MOFRL family protein [Shewanella sp. ALD9]
MNKAAVVNIDLQQQLENNNSHLFFSAIDDLIITGPTNTNVNDFRVIMIH